MLKARDFGALIYHEKLIHKAWLSKAALSGEKPSSEVSELVSELLITSVEGIVEGQPRAEEIRRAAKELGDLLLPNMSLEKVYTIYRDYVIDSIIEFAGYKGSPEHWQSLITLSNSITEGLAEAHANFLSKSIRRQRSRAFSSELTLAKRIQSHLLPKVIPQIPGYEFAGRLVPAAEVGGDYWSIKHYPGDGVVTMKVADITGHGVAAATLVAAVKFVSGGYYPKSASAAEVMYNTNRVLTRETPHDILVTMIYGWLRPNERKITLVNAGHEPVFICKGDGSCLEVPPTGPVLGLDESSEYKEIDFDLHEGDIVFFGSDGITEAGIGEPFGMERLKKLVSDNPHLSADNLADKVVQTVREYVGETRDDISLLITKVTENHCEKKNAG